MERITVEISVICPTHQQLIGYIEARNWHMIARRKHKNGATYSHWEITAKHFMVDIHESPEFSDYYAKQRDVIILLADCDKWLDEYSLVQQLLRGGIQGQDSEVNQSDKTKRRLSDMSIIDHSSLSGGKGYWQALDSTSRTNHISQKMKIVRFKLKGTWSLPCPFVIIRSAGD
ncbi:MAG: hypothetical protein H0X30_32200 [Anaerolineae bacterium]|nr:hypothetical protein [Anaerolineae bacterium]